MRFRILIEHRFIPVIGTPVDVQQNVILLQTGLQVGVALERLVEEDAGRTPVTPDINQNVLVLVSSLLQRGTQVG